MVFWLLFSILLLSFLVVDANRCRFRESRVGEQTIIRMTRGCRGAGTMIGEDYWTSIGYDGVIRDGRSQNDFLSFPRDANNYHDVRNGYIAYWITRSKYGSNHHYEAFGHAFVRQDRRICAWFVGLNKDVQEVCGGFRVLSRSRKNPQEQNPFEWVQGETVQSRDTLGFHHHRIAKYESAFNDVFYGDARIQDHNFQGVSPLSQDFIEVTAPSEFYSRVWLLRRRSDAPSPNYFDERYGQDYRYIQDPRWNRSPQDQDYIHSTNQQNHNSPHDQEHKNNQRVINSKYRSRFMQLPPRFPNEISKSWRENGHQKSRQTVLNTEQNSPDVILSKEELIDERVDGEINNMGEYQNAEGVQPKEIVGSGEDENAKNPISRMQADIGSISGSSHNSGRNAISSERYFDSERNTNSAESGLYQENRDERTSGVESGRELTAPLQSDDSTEEFSVYNEHDIKGGGAAVGYPNHKSFTEVTRRNDYQDDYSSEGHRTDQENVANTGSEPVRQLVRYIKVRPPIILRDQFGREYETKIKNGNIYYYADPHTQINADELSKNPEMKNQENQHLQTFDHHRGHSEHTSETIEQQRKQEVNDYDRIGRENKESEVHQQLSDPDYANYREHIKRIMDERRHHEAKLHEKDLEEMRNSGIDKRLDDSALRHREHLRRMQEYRRLQELRWRQEAEEWLRTHQHISGCKGQHKHENYEPNSHQEVDLHTRLIHRNQFTRESDSSHLPQTAGSDEGNTKYVAEPDEPKTPSPIRFISKDEENENHYKTA